MKSLYNILVIVAALAVASTTDSQEYPAGIVYGLKAGACVTHLFELMH